MYLTLFLLKSGGEVQFSKLPTLHRWSCTHALEMKEASWQRLTKLRYSDVGHCATNHDLPWSSFPSSKSFQPLPDESLKWGLINPSPIIQRLLRSSFQVALRTGWPVRTYLKLFDWVQFIAVSMLEFSGVPLEVKLVTVARLKFPSWLHAAYASSHVPPVSLSNAHNHKSFSIFCE